MWHEIKRGPKYGISTVMPERLEKLTITEGNIRKSSPYEAISYYLVELSLASFRKHSDHSSIIDLGCGKGRVMTVAAHFGFTSIKGIDFAKELCEEAEKNMMKTAEKFQNLKWEVNCNDVLNYPIQPNDSVFFMFNPFEKDTLEKFLDKLGVSVAKFPRPVWFIYASPVYLDSLLKYGYKIIEKIRPEKALNAIILKKESSS